MKGENGLRYCWPATKASKERLNQRMKGLKNERQRLNENESLQSSESKNLCSLSINIHIHSETSDWQAGHSYCQANKECETSPCLLLLLYQVSHPTYKHSASIGDVFLELRLSLQLKHKASPLTWNTPIQSQRPHWRQQSHNDIHALYYWTNPGRTPAAELRSAESLLLKIF